MPTAEPPSSGSVLVNCELQVEGIPTQHVLHARLKRGWGSFVIQPPWSTGNETLISVRCFDVTATVAVTPMEPSTLPRMPYTATDLVIRSGSSVTWGEGQLLRIEGNVTVEPGASLMIAAGTVLLMSPKVNFFVKGTLSIIGSALHPVVITSNSNQTFWGGIIAEGPEAHVSVSSGMLLRSGANVGQRAGFGHGHRREQPAILARYGPRVEMDHSLLSDGIGQALGGTQSSFVIHDVLVQRFITGGQMTDSSVILDSVCFTDFPSDDLSAYSDGDNDAFYIIGGNVSMTDSIFMFSLDDCLDSGSGPNGYLLIQRCWFESCFHEGLGLSNRHDGDKTVIIRDSVVLNCQTGIELGCSPHATAVSVEHSLIAQNQVGVRYGDNNLHCAVDGFLTVSDSLIAENRWDLWNYHHGAWGPVPDRFIIRSSLISTLDPDPVRPRPDPAIYGNNVFGKVDVQFSDGWLQLPAASPSGGDLAAGPRLPRLRGSSSTTKSTGVQAGAWLKVGDGDKTHHPDLPEELVHQLLQDVLGQSSVRGPAEILLVVQYAQSITSEFRGTLTHIHVAVMDTFELESLHRATRKYDVVVCLFSLIHAMLLESTLLNLKQLIKAEGSIATINCVLRNGPMALPRLDVAGRQDDLESKPHDLLARVGLEMVSHLREVEAAALHFSIWQARIARPAGGIASTLPHTAVQIREETGAVLATRLDIVKPVDGECFSNEAGRGIPVELVIEHEVIRSNTWLLLLINGLLLKLQLTGEADLNPGRTVVKFTLAGTLQLANHLYVELPGYTNLPQLTTFHLCAGHEAFLNFVPTAKSWLAVSRAGSSGSSLPPAHIDLLMSDDAAYLAFDGTRLPIRVRKFGRGSDFHCERKSWHVTLTGEPSAERSALFMRYLSVDVQDFMLVNMCFDKGFIRYRMALAVLDKLGLFPSAYRYIHVRLNGVSNGVYLLIENILSAIPKKWPAMDIVAQRARSGSLKTFLGIPKGPEEAELPLVHSCFIHSREEVSDGQEFKEGLLWHLPSMNRTQASMAFFQMLTAAVGVCSKHIPDTLHTQLEYTRYLGYLAFNSLVMNGDYVDEIFFFRDGHSKRWSFLGWDYDDVMSICHHSQSFALRDPLLYCAESILDLGVRSPSVRKDLLNAFSLLMGDESEDAKNNGGLLSVDSFSAIVAEVGAELRAYFWDDSVTMPMMQMSVADANVLVVRAAAQLIDLFEMRYHAMRRVVDLELSMLMHPSTPSRMAHLAEWFDTCTDANNRSTESSTKLDEEWFEFPVASLFEGATFGREVADLACLSEETINLVALSEADEATPSFFIVARGASHASLSTATFALDFRIAALLVGCQTLARFMELKLFPPVKIEAVTEDVLNSWRLFAGQGAPQLESALLLWKCDAAAQIHCESSPSICSMDAAVLNYLIGLSPSAPQLWMLSPYRAKFASDLANWISCSEDIYLPEQYFPTTPRMTARTAWHIMRLTNRGYDAGEIVWAEMRGALALSTALEQQLQALSGFEKLLQSRLTKLYRFLQQAVTRFGVHATIIPSEAAAHRPPHR